MLNRKPKLPTMKEFYAKKAKSAEKAAKRLEKRKQLGIGKPKRVSTSLLHKKLDELWSFAVRLRDKKKFGDTCRIQEAAECSGTSQVAYHLVPRGSWGIRWDLDNGVAACCACNRGEQLNRQKYARLHDRLFGIYFMDKLNEKADAHKRFDGSDLERIRVELQKFISEVSGQAGGEK